MTAVIVTVMTVAVVTEVIVTYFSKKQLDTSTTDEMFSVQLFAILAKFFLYFPIVHHKSGAHCEQIYQKIKIAVVST